MQTSGGATALMYACQQCRESEVLEILRKQPNSVKDRDRTLKTPLHYCAENPNTSCAEAVLKVAPELVNAQDENGYCPLHLAVIAGNKPLIKLLITKGADVNIHDNEGHSAVHWAIVSSEKEALEMIIRAGANPSTPDIHGGYPLHYAVQMCGSNCEYLRSFEDTVRVVESLLNFGVDVNVKDKDGRQPILWAASAGSADAVIHLVSSGACVEAADKDGLTALHCAASRGHTTTLETLISLCGANVDVIDGNGCSALFYSVTLGHADATELLLQMGAEPNRQDRKGRTPAHCGAAKGQLETLRILEKHGGNLWMRNVKGDIPLHEAVASGRKDLVIWLLSQNSEAINLANNDGRCPLHIASMYNNTEMVKVLLDSKSLVNPVMRTSKGVLMTPLNVALCKGHRSCGKYLQLHGGVPFSKVSRAEPTSVFAVRVSPSDDMVTESRKENVGSSYSKISKSRSSSDIAGNQEVIKIESGDKKKVYRRRKKKKIPSNLNTQDSDSGSDDSTHELKVKSIDGRKSDKSNEDNDEGEEKKEQDAKVAKKEKSRKPRSTKQQEIAEEAAAVKNTTKAKTEAKHLQRNKSFNETKNLSDLSPEDFPPRMQIINQLDTVIMEPDVDVGKIESENNESRLQDAVVVEATSDTVVEVNDKAEVFSNKENNTQEEDGNKQEEVKTQEKLKKTADVKKANGGNRKTETPASKTSNDETSARKSVKSPKSSNDEISVKKKAVEGLEKQKKSKTSVGVIPNQSEKSSETVVSDKKEETEKDEIKNNEEVNGDEKTQPKSTTQTVSDEKLEKEVAEDVKPDSKSFVEESNNDQEKPDLETEIQPKEDTIAENTVEVTKTEEEETKNTVVEEPIVEAKTVEEGEISLIRAMKNEGSFLGEEKDVKEMETLIPKENKEKLTVELSEPSEVFLSELSKNTSEKNYFEKPSEESSAIGKPSLTEELKQEIPVHDSKNESDKKPEENKKLNPDKEDAVEEKSDALDKVKEEEEHQKQQQHQYEKKQQKQQKLQKQHHKEQQHYQQQQEQQYEQIQQKQQKQHQQQQQQKELHLYQQQEQQEQEEKQQNQQQKQQQKQEQEQGQQQQQQQQEQQEQEQGQGHQHQHQHQKQQKQKQEQEQEQGQEKEQVSEAEDEENGNGDSPTKKSSRLEQRHHKTARVSRLCRRHKEFKDDMDQISVTQLVQNTIRKYHMERGIFYQLLELKRYQIRSGKANEQVLVKRLADEYDRSRVFLGMKPFSGLYKFREFEKFLYDQLKALNARRSFLFPEVKSYDEIDALSGFLKKSRYKIISEIPQPEMVCTCITQRCHHSACAYTSVPCSAYITDLRRHRHHRPKRESFFPRIEQPPPSYKSDSQRFNERPATLELIQGSEKHVITLPQSSPTKGKRYYVTFTIKGAPGFKEENSKDFFQHRHAKSV